MDNTKRFSGKADDYRSARPGYPAALAGYLASLGMSGAAVADVGAGTGLFSRLLLDLGCTVFAVEPNDDMRAAAQQELGTHPRFFARGGTAEATGLPAESVSFVTAAQAFHWFSPEAFRLECRRILRPGGMAVLVWNSRVEDDEAVRENAALCRRFCPQFTGFSGGNWQQTERNLRVFFDGEPQRLSLQHDLFYTKDKFIRRNLSASYSLREGDENYGAYLEAIGALFDRYAQDGLLRVPNVTAAYWGRLTP